MAQGKLMVVPTSNSLPESDSSERKVEEHTSVASGFCRSEFGEDSNMETNKKENSYGADSRRKGRPSEKVEGSIDVLYRILIPTFHAGSIIGKQGSIIGTVRQETGARIHITPSGHGVEERVISIFCSANGPEEWSQADDALMRLLELSNGISELMEKDGSQITFRMLVSGSQTGSLIGKRGAKINQIREKTKASIRVIEDAPSGSYPGDRIIVVGGTFSEVKEAILTISSHMKNHPPREGISNLWKGQSDFQFNVRPSPQVMLLPLSLRPREINLDIVREKAILRRDSDHGWRRRDRVDIRKRDRSSEREFVQSKRSPSSNQPSRGSPVSASRIFRHTVTEMHIPVSDMGKIIGKNGSKIERVRTESGASVRILDSTRGSDVRLVEIIGDAEQVANAQRMINKLID